MLRRSEGDFEEILAGSDLIVELIGGIEPARSYVLAALRAGKPVVTANKQLVAQHGDELFAAAREAGVQLRFEAAVAGAIPVIRVVQESLGALEIERISGIVNGTTNFILSEMAATGADYAEVLARAQELGYAEADPTEDVNGADAAAKMAILARLAFDTPVGLERRLLRGDRGDPSRRHRLRARARTLAEAARGRRAPRRWDQRPRLPLLPLRRPSAGTGRGRRSTRSRSRRRRSPRSRCRAPAPAASRPPRRCSATSSRSSPARRPCTSRAPRCRFVSDLDSSFYLHLEVADRPGVLASIAEVLGRNELSVKSVVQRGLGDEARLVMVLHRALRAALLRGGRRDRGARVHARSPRGRSG